MLKLPAGSLVLAAFLCFLVGCSGQASGKAAKKTSKKAIPKKPAETFIPPPPPPKVDQDAFARSEEHTSELQSQSNLVCRLLLEKKKKKTNNNTKTREKQI